MGKKISLMVRPIGGEEMQCVIAEYLTKRSITFNRPIMGFNGKNLVIFDFRPDLLFSFQIEEDKNEPGLFWEK